MEVHCERLDPEALLEVLKAGRYNSTQGPALKDQLPRIPVMRSSRGYLGVLGIQQQLGDMRGSPRGARFPHCTHGRAFPLFSPFRDRDLGV